MVYLKTKKCAEIWPMEISYVISISYSERSAVYIMNRESIEVYLLFHLLLFFTVQICSLDLNY